jgi:multidrug transporter EmrE-like cation transporter
MSYAMSSTKIIAIVLIIAGVLGLAYGSFTYTKETHDAKVGPLEFSVKDKETVNIPVWAGVGAIVIGAGLLLAGGRRT